MGRPFICYEPPTVPQCHSINANHRQSSTIAALLLVKPPFNKRDEEENAMGSLETQCICCSIAKDLRGDVCCNHHVHPEGISAADVDACNEIYGKIVSGMVHYLDHGSFHPGLRNIVKQYNVDVGGNLLRQELLLGMFAAMGTNEVLEQMSLGMKIREMAVNSYLMMVVHLIESGVCDVSPEIYRVKQFFHRRNSCNCLKKCREKS